MFLLLDTISTINGLEKLERDFLREGIEMSFKYYHVSWTMACNLVRKGGLGNKKLALFYKALVVTWLWRFTVDTKIFVFRVVATICNCSWGGWSNNTSSTLELGVERHLLSLV